MSAGFSDRAAISTIHGLPPANRRNASDQASKPGWRQPPTRVPEPSRNGGPLNPFGRQHFRDSLTGSTGGNPSASRTVSNFSAQQRAPKRPRTETDAPSRKKVSIRDSAHIPRNSPSDPIDIFDEDVGMPLARPSVSNDPSGTVSDGPYTMKLKQDMNKGPPRLAPENLFDDLPEPSKEVIDIDDPITQFSEKRDRPSTARVDLLKERFEMKKESNKSPHLDLDKRQIGKKSNIAKAMRKKSVAGGKELRQTTLHSTVASSSKTPIRAQPKAGPMASSSKQAGQEGMLPIETWRMGSLVMEGNYQLSWSGDLLMINDTPNVDQIKECIIVPEHIESFKFDDWNEQQNKVKHRLLILHSHAVSPRESESTFGAGAGHHFKRGANRGLGNVIIKFDTSSVFWGTTRYQALIQWLKRHVPASEAIRGQSSLTLWSMVDRDKLFLQADQERKTQFKPKVGESTQGRAIANTAKKREFHGNPANVPIEVGSPGKSAEATSGLRRSARRSVGSSATPGHGPAAPVRDPDELILVYPPGQTGAVNITGGDLQRLVPGEFLNDTLIEFGLKLWLRQMEEQQPELASQIHVFSSFFYKKMNNKKSLEDGYASVRKWTSKMDLFKKKYIVVPINENLHWYLAIIYQPEHILVLCESTASPSTRSRARQEAAGGVSDITLRPPLSKDSTATRRSSSPAKSATLSPRAQSPNSNNMEQEMEVANQLTEELSMEDGGMIPNSPRDSLFDAMDDDFVQTAEAMDVDAAGDEDMIPGSLIGGGPMPEIIDLSDSQEPPTMSEKPPNSDLQMGDIIGGDDDDDELAAASSPLTDLSVDELDAFRGQSPARQPGPDLFGDDIVVEHASSSRAVIEIEDKSQPVQEYSAVSTQNFYGSSKARGKRKAESPPRAEPTSISVAPDHSDVEIEGEEDIPPSDGIPKTYIFILDSLGGRHPKAGKVLSSYLQFEARDKKGMAPQMLSQAVCKNVQVPLQPNFCDCGLFLLHFAKTFMSDPQRYFEIAANRKKRTAAERSVVWAAEQIKTLRADLKARIEELSADWKVRQAEKKEADKQKEATQLESSDDEVDIVDTPVVKVQER